MNHGCVYFSGGNLDKSKAIEAHNQVAILRAENERLKKDKELLTEEINAIRHEITGHERLKDHWGV
jgi:hypothetical protein